MPCKVLIITPDVRLGDATRAALRRRGIEASTCACVDVALGLFRTSEPDVAVIDLALPRLAVIDFCRTVRSHALIPLLVIGPEGTEEDGEILLGIGADGYHKKPMPPRHLAALTLALLRRRGYVCTDPQRHMLRVGCVEIDLDSDEVRCGEQDVALTPKELAVLRHMAKAPTRVISHDSLVEHVCRRMQNGEEAIESHISRLRRKLYSVPTCDITLAAIPGLGYALLPPMHGS